MAIELLLAAAVALAGPAEFKVGFAENEHAGACLALSDGERTGYLVSVRSDAAQGFAEALRARIAAERSCDPECVLVVGERTRVAPKLTDFVPNLFSKGAVAADDASLRALADMAQRAADDLKPAEVLTVRPKVKVNDGVVEDDVRTVRFARADGDLEVVDTTEASGFPSLVCRRAVSSRGEFFRPQVAGAIRGWSKTFATPLRKVPTPEVTPDLPADLERMRLLADKPETAPVVASALYVGKAVAFVGLSGVPMTELCRRIRWESPLVTTLVGGSVGAGVGYLYDYGTWPDESYPSLSTCFTQAGIARIVGEISRACAVANRTASGIDAARAAADAPAKWISGATDAPECPAPVLFREFALAARPQKAVFEIAVAGWSEVYVNGRKIGTDVLSPVTCQPDKRLSSLALDVTDALVVGTNRLEVWLGNGWFNTFTRSSWGFPTAVWRGCPKVRGRLVADGRNVLVTDADWRVYDSPIVFTALRNGEWYDARLEGTRPNLRDATVVKYAPWGKVTPETAVPCREGETFDVKRILHTTDGRTVYDFGANIAGWCEIEVVGERGAKVTLDYDESLTPSNTPLGHITVFAKRGGETRPIQHDEYTLAGRPDGERWHARFTYHGFRYALATIEGRAEIKSIRARFVHSDFRCAGTLETSDPTFAALQAATTRSYLSNFTGIPTDCPHREKNGWTGDAQLALETGLWNFEAKDGYVHFLRMMLDAQLPNGAVPCILPHSTTFGFGWGSGPAWDDYLFEAPEQVFRFTGDDAPAREAYGAMKRYLAFISEKADADGLFDYGLKDYSGWKRRPTTGDRFTDTCYVYQFNLRLARWAERFGEPAVAAECRAAAQCIRASFNRVFYRGDGLYDSGSLTALAAPLYFEGLCADGEARKVVDRLVRTVRAGGHRAYFGILGAKWVPRVLADFGFIDDAWRLFVQPERPGWAPWLTSGDGTLHEQWPSGTSHNHIMYGDLSAWAYEYVGGIKVLEPGFRKVAIRPQFPEGLESFAVTHRAPQGEIRVNWKRVNGKPEVTCSVPDGVEVVK